MKFAICNETFEDWPFDKAFAFARECGYTGIEIAPFTINSDATQITSDKRAEVKEQAKNAGLEVVGLHWLLAKTEGFYLTSPDKNIRQKTADYFKALAHLCADLGGSILVLGSPQQRNLLPGVTLQDAHQYALDVIQQIIPTLEETKVTLALEPLGPSEGDFLTTAEEGIQLLKMCDSPYVQLHLDCKAMSSESEPVPEIIRKYHSSMAHFHANDPNRLGPGFGELSFPPIFQALKDVNYQGWVSVEVFDYSPGIEHLTKQSMQNMLDAIAQVS
ncbi:Xylose isomerase domain-containing protein TIM barrel [Planctomycetales bacterium 10988]|nr:Xylose isomerase domain-containing protein TIM barrel [Planctomycetales bacterium 10988]